MIYFIPLRASEKQMYSRNKWEREQHSSLLSSSAIWGHMPSFHNPETLRSHPEASFFTPSDGPPPPRWQGQSVWEQQKVTEAILWQPLVCCVIQTEVTVFALNNCDQKDTQQCDLVRICAQNTVLSHWLASCVYLYDYIWFQQVWKLDCSVSLIFFLSFHFNLNWSKVNICLVLVTES